MLQFTSKILKKMPKIIFVTIIVLSFSSCKDFFEEDLSEHSVNIITPSNNSSSTSLNITFDWDDVDGATSYQMLLGCPSLNNPSALYVDSSLTLSTVQYSLSPGYYEWKVRAVNNSSETDYTSVYHFRIDSSFNLGNHTVALYSPEDNLYTNDVNFSFSWQDLYAAETYQFVLKSGTNWNTGVVMLDTAVTSTTLLNNLNLSEDNYLWSVKALNSLPSETSFAFNWSFNVDLTAPNSCNLNTPNASTTGLYSDSLYIFDWSRSANNGTVQSSLFDSVFIYSDTIQNSIDSYGILENVDTATIVLPSQSGTYYWNVKTYDKAGNSSQMPYFSSFTVN